MSLQCGHNEIRFSCYLVVIKPISRWIRIACNLYQVCSLLGCLLWNILTWFGDMENSDIFKTMKRQWNILITGSWLDAWRTVRFSKQWKDNGTFWSLDHDWMHGEQWDFQNNEKTMEHSDHWIMTGCMENSEIFKTMKRQWNILITGSWLDDMENSEIFKTMIRQWNILITGSWLDAWRTVRF